MYIHICIYIYIYIYIYISIYIHYPGSPFAPPPPGTSRSPNPCECAHFSHMAAPKPSTVTRTSSQTHPIHNTEASAFPLNPRHQEERDTYCRGHNQ